MTDKSYTTSVTVDNAPEDVYNAILNVRGWWSQEIKGDTDKVGAVFYYHFRDIHQCTIEIVELLPGKKVSWHVLNNNFSFTKDKSEWNDTDVIFEISEKNGKTELTFTHIGLTPAYECYNACSDGWGTYIHSSLKSLIVTGKGQPNEGDPRNETEARLSSGEQL